MLTYLRELYEIYASGKVAPPAPKASKEEVAPVPAEPVRQEVSAEPPAGTAYRAASTPPASAVAPPSVSVPPDPPPPAPDAAFSKPARPVDPPVDEYGDLPIPPAPEVRRGPSPAAPAPAMASQPASTHHNPAPAAAPTLSESLSRRSEPARPEAPRYPKTESDGELSVLFEDAGATSRFGRMPLNDLTRALSINNRILFTRDLCGGDNELLSDTLQQLNSCRDMPEAKPLISSLARRFDWTAEGKLETAREFVELVRRRYV